MAPPLQCSCLENPRDGGACWAAIYGVAQSRTQLKRLSSSSSKALLQGNFMDRADWQAIVHGVTKSRTLMSNFHFQSEVRLQFIPLGSDHIPIFVTMAAAATAAKLLQSCSTLCDPKDGGPPGSAVPGILQATVLEWGAISFSNA